MKLTQLQDTDIIDEDGELDRPNVMLLEFVCRLHRIASDWRELQKLGAVYPLLKRREGC